MLLLIFFIFFEAFCLPFREAAASLRREKEYITHTRFVSSALFSFFEFYFFTARYCALLRTPLLVAGILRVCATLRLCFANPGDFTVRFCARPCLWQWIGRDAERVFLPAKIPEAYAVALESPVFVQPCGTKSHPDYFFLLCYAFFMLYYNRTIRGTRYERKYR